MIDPQLDTEAIAAISTAITRRIKTIMSLFPQDKKYEFLYSFDLIRKEIRNEMILMAYLLERNANKLSLENIKNLKFF